MSTLAVLLVLAPSLTLNSIWRCRRTLRCALPRVAGAGFILLGILVKRCQPDDEFGHFTDGLLQTIQPFFHSSRGPDGGDLALELSLAEFALQFNDFGV